MADRAMRAIVARRQSAMERASAGATGATPTAPQRLEPPSVFNTSALDSQAPDVAPDEFAPQKVLHLARWPQMRTLPADELLASARILALLAHGPSFGFLVHRRLDLPRERVMPLLFRLHADGYLRTAGSSEAADVADAATTAPAAVQAPPSIWTKLLRKLRT